MPPAKNSRLVYSTDPDADVQPRRVKKSRHRSKAQRNQPKLPNDGVIRVFLERKGRGGKSVSVLRGLRGDAAARKKLLKQLKSRLGTGGSLKDDVIEIQGDHRDRIVELLTQMGHKVRKAGG